MPACLSACPHTSLPACPTAHDGRAGVPGELCTYMRVPRTSNYGSLVEVEAVGPSGGRSTGCAGCLEAGGLSVPLLRGWRCCVSVCVSFVPSGFRRCGGVGGSGGWDKGRRAWSERTSGAVDALHCPAGTLAVPTPLGCEPPRDNLADSTAMEPGRPRQVSNKRIKAQASSGRQAGVLSRVASLVYSTRGERRRERQGGRGKARRRRRRRRRRTRPGGVEPRASGSRSAGYSVLSLPRHERRDDDVGGGGASLRASLGGGAGVDGEARHPSTRRGGVLRLRSIDLRVRRLRPN